MGINGGRGIVGSGSVLGGSGISLAGGTAPFSFGNALKFDGVNDYVETNNNIGISGSTPRSISFWFKTTFTSLQTVVQFQNGYFLQFLNSGKLSLNPAGGTQAAATLDFSISDGNWHHFVFVQEGSTLNTMKIYLDGFSQSMTYTNATYTINTQDLPIRIGRRFSDNVEANGTFDEIAIWDVALSATDASNLYNSGDGDFANNYSSENLKLYYRCNEEGSATTLVDEQGINNGTLNNFSTPPAYFVPH